MNTLGLLLAGGLMSIARAYNMQQNKNTSKSTFEIQQHFPNFWSSIQSAKMSWILKAFRCTCQSTGPIDHFFSTLRIAFFFDYSGRRLHTGPVLQLLRKTQAEVEFENQQQNCLLKSDKVRYDRTSVCTWRRSPPHQSQRTTLTTTIRHVDVSIRKHSELLGRAAGISYRNCNFVSAALLIALGVSPDSFEFD